jgi:hypothetical protein
MDYSGETTSNITAPENFKATYEANAKNQYNPALEAAKRRRLIQNENLAAGPMFTQQTATESY